MTPIFHPRALLAALGVALMPAIVQAAQVPTGGFFADPIVTFVLRMVSVVLSLALSGTIIVACVKMIAYFGAAGEAQRNLSDTVRNAGLEFHEFRSEIRAMHDKFTDMLQAHDRLLTAHETTNGDFERRLGQIESGFHRRKDD